MSDPLWHQAIRAENYEPLDQAEAEAVAIAASAILERAPASGSASLSDHRAAFTSIGYHIGIKGWERAPDAELDELGGMSIMQLQPVLQRAISSGSKYLRVSIPKDLTKPAAATDDAALQRIRDRLNKRKETDES